MSEEPDARMGTYPKEWHDLASQAVHSTDALENFIGAVLKVAAKKLHGIPVGATALVGPVWYGSGFKDAIDCLEEMGDAPHPWLVVHMQNGPQI